METATPRSEAIVGLGKNWGRKDQSRQTGIYYPSIDTARTAIACGEIYVSSKKAGEDPPKLFFSTGHTIKNGPTEALAMKLQLRTVFSEDEIPDDDILLEEDSIDTAGNAEYVTKLAEEHGITDITLVATWRQRLRALRDFRFYGAPVQAVYATENVLKARNYDISRSITNRAGVILDTGLEGVLLTVQTFNPEGTAIRKVTERIRK